MRVYMCIRVGVCVCVCVCVFVEGGLLDWIINISEGNFFIACCVVGKIARKDSFFSFKMLLLSEELPSLTGLFLISVFAIRLG